MNLFNEEETFEAGSTARKAAHILAGAGEALSELQPGWEFSPAKREMLGLDPEFGALLAQHYQDWS